MYSVWYIVAKGERKVQKSCNLSSILKYLCLTFTLIFLCGLRSYNVNAASAEVSIQSSEKHVVKGDIVYVIITVSSSDTMSGFEGYFSYDSRVLQYITGGNVTNGNDDKFQISDTGRESGVSTLRYSVKFVARKTGTTSIELKQPSVVYSSEDSSKMSLSSDTLNITVADSVKKADSAEIKVSARPEDKQPENTKIPTAEPDITETPEPSVAPKKDKKDKNNKKSSSKTYDIEEKKTSDSVTATYQNGITKIHFYDEYTVTDVENEKDIPAGFGKTEIVLSGHVITAYATENDIEHTYVLIYCKRGRQEPQFYLYDTENDSFMPYDKVKSWYKGAVGNAVVGSDSIYETKIKTMKYIVAIMVIICLLMLIGMLTIYLHYRENNNIIDVHDDFEEEKSYTKAEDELTQDNKKTDEHEPSYEENFESESVKDESVIIEDNRNVVHYWKRD